MFRPRTHPQVAAGAKQRPRSKPRYDGYVVSWRESRRFGVQSSCLERTPSRIGSAKIVRAHVRCRKRTSLVHDVSPFADFARARAANASMGRLGGAARRHEPAPKSACADNGTAWGRRSPPCYAPGPGETRRFGPVSTPAPVICVHPRRWTCRACPVILPGAPPAKAPGLEGRERTSCLPARLAYKAPLRSVRLSGLPWRVVRVPGDAGAATRRSQSRWGLDTPRRPKCPS